jgi:hypothetical protein
MGRHPPATCSCVAVFPSFCSTTTLMSRNRRGKYSARVNLAITLYSSPQALRELVAICLLGGPLLLSDPCHLTVYLDCPAEGVVVEHSVLDIIENDLWEEALPERYSDLGLGRNGYIFGGSGAQ